MTKKAKTLYEISKRLELLEDHLLENPDEDNASIEEYLSEEKQDEAEKLDGYANVIERAKNRITVRKEKIKDLQSLIKSDEAMVKRLEATLLWYFKKRNIKKVSTDERNLVVTKSGGKLRLIMHDDVDLDKLPEKYVTTEVVKKPNQEMIRIDLDKGAPIDFAHYGERSESVRIKPIKWQTLPKED